ncbi:DUF4429 domain-containing protein [Companilactobacillus sp. HBUAS59699]|uniref:DUF4429 domain-containing protein n=1 Tax=Companilactobacillus sp. HBUAS59699 TaxID=3109358 RepID=UPI002FF08ECE
MEFKEIILKHPGKTIISYDNDKITITRKGALNFMNQGIKGAKAVPLKLITSIQLKKYGMTNGYIQFGVLGGLESRPGVFNATQDENTVMFSKKYYDNMVELKENIEKIIFSKSSDNQSVLSTAIVEKTRGVSFMNLEQYLGKKIKVVFIDNQVLEGVCNTFTPKFDTDDELYNEITIQTTRSKYVGFNESEIKSIEVI